MERQKRLQRLICALFVSLLVVGCNPSAVRSTPIQPDAPSMSVTPVVAQPTSTQVFRTPTVTNVVTLSPTAAPAPGTVLFEENFDDGLVQDFTYISGNWNVLVDEAGNKVLDGDNRLKSDGAPSFEFGSRGWTDYALDFDIKMRNPTADVLLKLRNSNQGYYVHRLSLYYSHVSVFDTDWNLLKSRTYEFALGVWYHMRLEIQGNKIRVFIDENLEIETTDSQVQAGDVTFGVMAPTRVQLDNIRVTVLAPANPDQP